MVFHLLGLAVGLLLLPPIKPHPLIGVSAIARNLENLALLLESIREQVVDIGGRQLLRTIEALIYVLGYLLPYEAPIQNVNNCRPIIWLDRKHLGDQVP